MEADEKIKLWAHGYAKPDVSFEMFPDFPCGQEPTDLSSYGEAHRIPFSYSLALNAWLAMHKGLDLQMWFEEQIKAGESPSDGVADSKFSPPHQACALPHRQQHQNID